MYNIVFPCMMMSSLTVLVFSLPPDSGEKIALGRVTDRASDIIWKQGFHTFQKIILRPSNCKPCVLAKNYLKILETG